MRPSWWLSLRRAGLVLALSSLGAVQAAPSPFTGVTWSEVEGLKLASGDPECPGRCVEYSVRDSGTVQVHEPVLGGAEAALRVYREWRERRLEPVQVLAQTAPEPVGSAELRATVLKVGDSDNNYTHILALLSRDGFTVPLEFADDGPEEAADLLQKYGIPLIGSLKLDPAALGADLRAREATFSQAAQALAQGYARGERAQVFVWSRGTVRMETVMVHVPPFVEMNIFTGPQLIPQPPIFTTEQRAVRLRNTLAFLPGGLFMTEDPEPDYRTPDLRRAWRGELPARWKAVPSGFEVTFPNGKTELYKAQKSGGAVVSLKSGDQEFLAAPALKTGDLAGRYGLGEFGESEAEFTLAASGSLSVRDLDFAPLLPARGGGRWAYDAPSLTLTFPLAGGGSGSTPAYRDPNDPELLWFPTFNPNEWRRITK